MIMWNPDASVLETENAMRAAMVTQLQRLGEATADAWERAVFESVTGQTREDVDWTFPDNQAGYYMWIKSFDRMARALVEGGYVVTREDEDGLLFTPVSEAPPLDWAHGVEPAQG